MDFRALASSSDGCAYLLEEAGTAPLLVECGIPFKAIQKAVGFRTSALAGCVVSHAHGDHCRAAKDLARAGVDVYALADTIEALGPANHRFNAIRAGETFWVGAWTVLPFEAVHDIPTVGFLIKAPSGDTLLYLTDSAFSIYRFDGLTHVAIEANYDPQIIRRGTASGSIAGNRYARTVRGHMSIDRVLEVLAANDLSRVREIHLLHLSSQNSDEAAFKTAVERATGKPTFVAAAKEATPF